MKKKTTIHKTAPKKTVKRTAPRSKITGEPIFFQRIIIISACLLLVVGVIATINRNAVTQAVAGVSITKGFFAQATIALPKISGAVSYNIYYKEVNSSEKDMHFPHAVRKIPANVSSYTISYLKKNKQYEYRISAIDASGKEFWWSSVKTMTNITSM